MRTENGICICDECGKEYKEDESISYKYCADCVVEVFERKNRRVLDWFHRLENGDFDDG